jgi:subtilisin family serine protease
MFKQIFLSCFLILSVTSSSVLLVPKNENFFMRSLLTSEFLEEHNVEQVADFKGFTIYTTTTDNYNTFQNTLDTLFDVEEDQTISLYGDTQTNFILVNENSEESVPWHLNSVTNNHWQNFSTSGSCHKNKDVTIHTYVVDTGIDVSHPQFEGRAKWLANFAEDGDDTDCQSHGTHCAGLVGSKSYGACRDAKLFAIKVLNCQGSGSLSGVIKGIQFAFDRHNTLSKDNTGVRSIVSMSLGGGFSRAINMAVESCLTHSNTFYFTVAAGNENADACNTSPASAKGVLTVMAMGEDNSRAYFSNFGKCADIYSPGVKVESTVPGGGTAKYSGSSMSTPLVAGVLNHYVDMYPSMNMAQIKKQMLKDARVNVITGNPKGTQNKMVYLARP